MAERHVWICDQCGKEGEDRRTGSVEGNWEQHTAPTTWLLMVRPGSSEYAHNRGALFCSWVCVRDYAAADRDAVNARAPF